MKRINQFLNLLLVITFFASCKKDTNIATSPLASLNIVNASVNLGTIEPNFTGTGIPNFWNGITKSIAYGSNLAFSVNANTSVPLSIATSADSTVLVYRNTLNFSNGSYYTLFLAGQAGAVDSIMIRESFTNYQDSSFGVRFINLSYNSNPIAITISTSDSINEFGPLSDNQYSDFKKYSGAFPSTHYTFQVRDAGTDSLLASYPVSPIPYFHNVTLAWIGETGGTGTAAPKVMRINHY